MRLYFYAMLIIVVSEFSFTQTAKDSADIRLAALNYAEGWYEGNTEKMASALHPRLAKRIVSWSTDIRKSENTLSEMNFDQLIDGTKRGFGKNTSKEKQIKNITILSMYNNSASVKLEMGDWIDFMHLGRWNGEWKIINVLWEMKPQE